jgi:adenosylmethionine-8-amino-7-oxononanoate aminotransferase
LEIGELRRSKFIARRQSYHGITLGALSVGGRLAARAPFIDMLIDVEHVSACYA